MRLNGKEVKPDCNYSIDIREIESIQTVERDWFNCRYDNYLHMKNGDEICFDGSKFIDTLEWGRISKAIRDYHWKRANRLVGTPRIGEEE